MTDKLTPSQRHKCMSHIHSKNTKPEMIVRRFLFKHGFRYRVHVKELPGTPDIVLKKYATVIFVNGCFWHGHEGCKYYVLPKSNVDFWKKKIERNQQRDYEERIQLRDMGWHVIQLWECQLRPKVRERNLEGLVYTLHCILLLNYQKESVRKKFYEIKDDEMMQAAESELPGYGGND